LAKDTILSQTVSAKVKISKRSKGRAVEIACSCIKICIGYASITTLT